jgi:hypothetical protein
MLRTFWTKTRNQIAQIRMGTSTLIDQTKAALVLKQKSPQTLLRQEFRLIEQNKRDLSALVPFILCTIIIPELLPLMILKGRVPSTMMTAEQLKERQSRLSKRRLEIASKFLSKYPKSLIPTTEEMLSDFGVAELRELNEFFDLKKYQLPWNYRRSIESHLQYLKKDDIYILNMKENTDDAIEAALFERGLPINNSTMETFLDIIKDRQMQSNVVYWSMQKTLEASEHQTLL